MLELMTYNYGKDISWEITTDNGIAAASGGSYESNQEYLESLYDQ